MQYPTKTLKGIAIGMPIGASLVALSLLATAPTVAKEAPYQSIKPTALLWMSPQERILFNNQAFHYQEGCTDGICFKDRDEDTNSVPEPATYILLTTGLLICYVYTRRSDRKET